MNKRKLIVIIAALLGVVPLLYLGGFLAQVAGNYRVWLAADGITGQAVMEQPDPAVLSCLRLAFTPPGILAMAGIIVLIAAATLYFRFRDRWSGKRQDPRGFTVSKDGLYGTAGWMEEKEMRQVLEVAPIEKAEGVILGESGGRAVCMPIDSRLNRHMLIFGASGTMKSRAVIRNALFQAIKRGESVILTDPKGELYEDTSHLFRESGYEVKVFNLIHPEHGDSWNCMADLNGDTKQAQMVTNVIINNTGSGQGDHFWDNGEGNLLKALILYVDQARHIPPEEKNLPAVYRLLTQNTEAQLTALFNRLPVEHLARASYHLFSQGSDTVKSGIILGLGTRLQVLQSTAVQGITSRSDIDLTAPARKKCAYYIILSDSESSMGFLSSLFFSFLLIKLPAYADDHCGGRCPVPANLILDEFNNIGRIGGDPTGKDFTRSLSTVRSRGIHINMVVQSVGQLQNRYASALWSEIMANADVHLMLGCSDEQTAEQFSLRSGEMSVEVESQSVTRHTLALTQMAPQYRQTQGHGRRRLLTPDEVLRLSNDELLCVIRGCKMLKLRKLDYTKHPMARRIRKTPIREYVPVKPAFKPPDIPKELPEQNKKPTKQPLYGQAKPPGDF